MTFDILRVCLEERYQCESADLSIMREVKKCLWDPKRETIGSWIARLNALWDQLEEPLSDRARVNHILLALEDDLTVQSHLSTQLSNVQTLDQLQRILEAFQDPYRKLKAQEETKRPSNSPTDATTPAPQNYGRSNR